MKAEVEKFNELKIRWYAFKQTSFPENIPDDTPNIEFSDLFEIDAFAAGCIETFIGHSGRLDQERVEVPGNCTIVSMKYWYFFKEMLGHTFWNSRKFRNQH